MKRLLSSLSLGLLVLPLAGCVDLDPAMLGGGGYGPGYGRPEPRPYYDGGRYERHDYDDHHHSSGGGSSSNYYGGPHAWYEAGVGIGKKDRRDHVSPNYRRHKTQYDGRTEAEFARGYSAGYNGR